MILSTLKKKAINYSRPIRHDIARFLAPILTHERELTRHFVELMAIKEMFGLVGVEVGVNCGVNAERILEIVEPKALYLIDCYMPYEQDGVIWNHSRNEVVARNRLKRFGDRALFIKQKSSEALKLLPPLDFAYIDACHDYESVKEDLRGAWAKLKKGGLLGGHDFCANFIGVTRAVLEFAEIWKVNLYGKNNEYWIWKP